MFRIKLIIALASSLLLSGCASTGLYVLNYGLKLKPDHDVTKDIAFGDKAWQKLDVHTSGSNQEQAKPVLIFFYGGSWDSGKKEMYFFAADAFVRRGYVVVIPDYVKYPQARFPMFIEDGAAAVAWTKQNIKRFGGDPEQVFIAGHSAGAHLGGLLLTDNNIYSATN